MYVSFSSVDIFSLMKVGNGPSSESSLTSCSLSRVACPPSLNTGGAEKDRFVSSSSRLTS